jgi:hypothetical protein
MVAKINGLAKRLLGATEDAASGRAARLVVLEPLSSGGWIRTTDLRVMSPSL